MDEQIARALELQEWAKFRSFSQDELPSSMSQAKVLAALPDAKQRAEVWQRVIESTGGHGITAKTVEAEVERYKAALSKNYITLDEWNAGERWHGGRTWLSAVGAASLGTTVPKVATVYAGGRVGYHDTTGGSAD